MEPVLSIAGGVGILGAVDALAVVGAKAAVGLVTCGLATGDKGADDVAAELGVVDVGTVIELPVVSAWEPFLPPFPVWPIMKAIPRMAMTTSAATGEYFDCVGLWRARRLEWPRLVTGE